MSHMEGSLWRALRETSFSPNVQPCKFNLGPVRLLFVPQAQGFCPSLSTTTNNMKASSGLPNTTMPSPVKVWVPLSNSRCPQRGWYRCVCLSEKCSSSHLAQPYHWIHSNTENCYSSRLSVYQFYKIKVILAVLQRGLRFKNNQQQS